MDSDDDGVFDAHIICLSSGNLLLSFSCDFVPMTVTLILQLINWMVVSHSVLHVWTSDSGIHVLYMNSRCL